VFADVHLNVLMAGGRIGVVDTHGEFNVLRIPFSLSYYFLPINFLRASDGTFLLRDFRSRYFDGIELPPSSFLLTDPAILILATTFASVLIRRRTVEGLDLQHASAVLTGLALPVGLILSYYFLAFRFRGEFYPLFQFAALLGFYAVSRVSYTAKWQLEQALGYAVIVGLFASHLMLWAYKISPFQSEWIVAESWAPFYSLAIREWATTLRDIW
jgi:hypothetical protein